MSEVIDLDEYRKRRTEEGTWPPDPLGVVEYWRKRRGLWRKPLAPISPAPPKKRA